MFQLCHGARAHSLEGDSLLRFCPAVRCNSDETALFLFQNEEAVGIRSAIEASIGSDMQHRVQTSLQETAQELRAEYPEEMTHARLAMRSVSDLSDFIEGNLAVRPTRPCTPGNADEVVPSTVPSWDGVPGGLSLDGVPAGIDASNLLQHDRLVDHEQLMEAIYAAQGLDLSSTQAQARQFLSAIGMRPYDSGIKNADETGRELVNQCFYLSIARAFLGHEAPTSGLALLLKRAVEASVLAARPEWASKAGLGAPGDEGVMAFADFLPIAMHSDGPPGKSNLLAELVVCILDSVAGHVEVYIGPKYNDLLEKDVQERNLVLLWYTPGHYQCVVHDDEAGSKVSMMYSSFKELLALHGVVYIETTH